MTESTDRTLEYEEGSLSLVGAIALGTGVMIGAGIFALTGQMEVGQSHEHLPRPTGRMNDA